MLDLLLLDADNPRSLAYQVGRLAEAIGSMPHPDPEWEERIAEIVDELATLIALADTNELARGHDGAEPAADGSPVTVATSLTAFLQRSGELLASLGDAIDRAHFSHQLPQRVVAVAPGALAPGAFLRQQQERRA
jgi:uncharacterized alpha-E superfamily protein